MIKNTIKLLFVMIFAVFCGFRTEAYNRADFDAVRSVSLSQEDDLYNLTIEFRKKVDFVPRIHVLPNGIQMFLSFKKPVNLPKISKRNHGILRGYFFEKFGNSSLMFIMALKQKVEFVKKIYTKNSIKISFRRKPTIIIDAGHGGKDPGTRSPYEKYLEKDIALITAVELRSALLKTGRYDVVLTRDKDEFISLDDRIKRAKSGNGDVLISLHTDYNKDKNLRGISVYTLPPHGFSESDQKFNYTLRKSKRFSKSLIGYIPNLCKIKHQACRSSDLKILRTGIPSILVELGCISNSKDSKLLLSKLFRKKVIYAILYALDEFFDKERKISKRQVVR